MTKDKSASSVETIVASLVHEIRNPLSSIKMGLTTLRRRPSLEDADQHIVNISLREMDRLEQMLKDLLAYARTRDLNCLEQNLNAIVESAVKQIMAQAEDKKIQIIRDLSADCSKIPVDSDQMIPVFVHLLQNSLDAMYREGRLVLQTFPDGDFIHLQISDNGTGIDEKHREKIFDPFYTTKTGRLGLGLTIAQKIIKLHQGEIQVEQTSNSGTLIDVRLPVTQL